MANSRDGRICIPATTGRAASIALAVAIAFLPALVPATPAQTYSVIHNFTAGQDGGYPTAGLTMDRAGNFYGTTAQGGSSGNGIVFKLTHSGSGWVLTPLYEFQGGNDGAGPAARVIFGPDGSLYGTTAFGGPNDAGTVFKLRPGATACKAAFCSWTETLLHTFSGFLDGANPVGDLVFDQVGNLYGTAFAGATGGCSGGYGDGCGVVFEMTPSQGSWNFNVLYSFSGRSDGGLPESGVTFDQSGSLYGTTVDGGAYGYGTVYESTPSGSDWTEKVIHSFSGGSDGAYPQAGLIVDQSGDLYGAAISRGNNNYGTAFELEPGGGSWNFNLLYSLGLQSGQPTSTLTLDNAGNLYGTANSGGKYGAGAVFKLVRALGWNYVSLHDFGNGNDGEYPHSSVLFDANGNLYGTTQYGGNPGAGTVWEITP